LKWNYININTSGVKMARIGDLVSSIQVGKKRFKKPEWWSTTHKLKKEIKYEQYCKANSNLTCSYRINTAGESKDINSIVSNYISDLSSDSHKVFAPWNPMFRQFKTIVIFRKNKT